MKRVTHNFLFALLLAASFAGCKKENMCDCFKSTGDETSVVRSLSGFDEIYVEGKLDVHIIEAPEFGVEIRGGKNLLGLVKTEVTGGVLKISNHNRCNFVRSYKRKLRVYVKMPSMRKVTHDGLGEIFCDNPLTRDTVFYQVKNVGDIHLKVNNSAVIGGVHGMGDIYLSGETNYHNANINGEGFLWAEGLKTDCSDLVLNTSGLSYIHVTGKLIVYIKEIGDVYYKGNPPVIQKDITGSGKLIAY